MAKYTIIEKVAAEFAGVYYETGRAQGLTSKWKNARLYSKHNFERFIPNAIEHLLTILNNPHTPKIMKDEILAAYLERANAPGLEILETLEKPRRIN